MKKILVTVLALAISLSIFGCAKAVKEEMPAPAPEATQQAPAEAPATPAAEAK